MFYHLCVKVSAYTPKKIKYQEPNFNCQITLLSRIRQKLWDAVQLLKRALDLRCRYAYLFFACRRSPALLCKSIRYQLTRTGYATDIEACNVLANGDTSQKTSRVCAIRRFLTSFLVCRFVNQLP